MCKVVELDRGNKIRWEEEEATPPTLEEINEVISNLKMNTIPFARYEEATLESISMLIAAALYGEKSF